MWYSFYSSQGRQTSFPDHNEDLIQQLHNEVEKVATLEVCFHTLLLVVFA
jgi:uridine phosphorylase